jgi:hypothetical protein
MSAAIGSLLADAPERRHLAAGARARSEEAFDLKRAVAGLLAHYAELTFGVRYGHRA